MRVSIVATSLDGQQPETKSVINMVHRIQNRNPGYSDFSNMGSSASFNFSNSISNPVSHGANALKLENEIVQEQNQEHLNSNVTNEEVLHSNTLETESVVEDSSVNEMEKSFTQEAMEHLKKQTVEEKYSKKMFLMILKNLVLTQMHQIYLVQKLKIQVQMIYYLQVMKRMMILRYQHS